MVELAEAEMPPDEQPTVISPTNQAPIKQIQVAHKARRYPRGVRKRTLDNAFRNRDSTKLTTTVAATSTTNKSSPILSNSIFI